MSFPTQGLDFSDGTAGTTTIAAIATPPGMGALSVVRLTGPDSSAVADRIFEGPGPGAETVADMRPHTCRFGRIRDPEEGSIIDEVVLTKYSAPRSYTGEEMVEISCHGGSAVRRCVMEAVLSAGALPAEPGAFTRRAFLNGKMDLSQAEAVMDLIASAASRTVRAAASQLNGVLSKKVRMLVNGLYDVIGHLEMSIEYPEHDEAGTAMAEIAEAIRPLSDNVRALCDSYSQGRMLREGLTVVIAGRPNVGKSSLLNRLAGFERAIVTEIAGTTRDTVEELMEIKGLPIRLIDTAGLRDTEDHVERKGIERTRGAMDDADLILWVSSPEDESGYPLKQEADDIQEAAGKTRLVVIAGKGDASGSRDHAEALIERLREQDGGDIPSLLYFSAMTGEGLEEIRGQIEAVYDEAGTPDGDEVVLLNARHAAAAKEAADEIGQAYAAIETGRDGRPALPPDMVSTLLRTAAEALSAITGDTVTDRIVETVFSRFCVGK